MQTRRQLKLPCVSAESCKCMFYSDTHKVYDWYVETVNQIDPSRSQAQIYHSQAQTISYNTCFIFLIFLLHLTTTQTSARGWTFTLTAGYTPGHIL